MTGAKIYVYPPPQPEDRGDTTPPTPSPGPRWRRRCIELIYHPFCDVMALLKITQVMLPE